MVSCEVHGHVGATLNRRLLSRDCVERPLGELLRRAGVDVVPLQEVNRCDRGGTAVALCMDRVLTRA